MHGLRKHIYTYVMTYVINPVGEIPIKNLTV